MTLPILVRRNKCIINNFLPLDFFIFIIYNQFFLTFSLIFKLDGRPSGLATQHKAGRGLRNSSFEEYGLGLGHLIFNVWPDELGQAGPTCPSC